MATLKCKMCGGELELTQGTNIAECPYCGTKQTVPFLDDDKKARLYNRANQYRLNNEFDKAYSAYETIITEKADEAEAYWGLILSEYGVEYVEDPATKKRVPTCHRTRVQSITSNENYKLACQYADAESRMMYEDDAEELDALQKKILNASAKEEPYDVFICYKETDDATGERTEDSVLAQNIYNELIRCGLRVFFSRVSLEDKLGKDYEACIYAALTSSKVMLMVTTDSEHCNAVWVKNEWKRYIDFMKNDNSKVLIPVYKNISPYALPDEFAKLQAQDMSKLGAIQDLVHGVEKIVGKTGGNQSGLKQHEKDLLNKLEKNQTQTKTYVISGVILLSVCALIYGIIQILGNYDIYLLRKYMFYTPKKFVTVDEVIPGPSAFVLLCLGFVYGVGLVCNYIYGLKSKVAHAVYFGLFAITSLTISILHICRVKATSFTMVIYLIIALIAIAGTVVAYLRSKKKFVLFLVASILLMAGTWIVHLIEHDQSNKRDTSVNQIIIQSDIVPVYKKIEKGLNPNEYIPTKQVDYVEQDDVFTVLQQKCKGEYMIYKIETNSKTEGYICVNTSDEVGFISAGHDAGKSKQSNERDVTVNQIKIITDYIPLKQEAAIKGAKSIAIVRKNEIYTVYDRVVLGNHVRYKIITHNGIEGYIETREDLTEWLEQERQVYEERSTKAESGDIIIYGSYEQDGNTSNGKEDVEWIVFKREGDKAFVISKNILDAQPYDSNRMCNSWAQSTLRQWCNTTFIQETFSVEEQQYICASEISTKPYSEKKKDLEPEVTLDRVFLLSQEEAEVILEPEMICGVTTYAWEQPVKKDFKEQGYLSYWLRTPSATGGGVVAYSQRNASGYGGYCTQTLGVRPVMWIDLGM